MAEPTRPFDSIWHEYQRTGDEGCKAELTRRFMPILMPIARRVRGAMGRQPELDDLVNAGVVGLLEAFERFDPGRGVKFETYCGWRVVGAMHDDQRKFDWASGALRFKAQRLRAAAEDLRGRLGRPPSDDELAEALDVSTAAVAEARRHAENRAPLSIDRSQAAEAPGEHPALSDGRADPARLLAADEGRALLLDSLRKLPDRQRYVLLLYYFEKLTMEKIGYVLGVSESRVCQLHKEALRALVRRLGARREELLDALTSP
ncbi:MAG: sigma-70 family RNA polymerase sigma factor [Candidatus Brocadiia bacterium]